MELKLAKKRNLANAIRNRKQSLMEFRKRKKNTYSSRYGSLCLLNDTFCMWKNFSRHNSSSQHWDDVTTLKKFRRVVLNFGWDDEEFIRGIGDLLKDDSLIHIRAGHSPIRYLCSASKVWNPKLVSELLQDDVITNKIVERYFYTEIPVLQSKSIAFKDALLKEKPNFYQLERVEKDKRLPSLFNRKETLILPQVKFPFKDIGVKSGVSQNLCITKEERKRRKEYSVFYGLKNAETRLKLTHLPQRAIKYIQFPPAEDGNKQIVSSTPNKIAHLSNIRGNTTKTHFPIINNLNHSIVTNQPKFPYRSQKLTSDKAIMSLQEGKSGNQKYAEKDKEVCRDRNLNVFGCALSLVDDGYSSITGAEILDLNSSYQSSFSTDFTLAYNTDFTLAYNTIDECVNDVSNCGNKDRSKNHTVIDHKIIYDYDCDYQYEINNDDVIGVSYDVDRDSGCSSVPQYEDDIEENEREKQIKIELDVESDQIPRVIITDDATAKKESVLESNFKTPLSNQSVTSGSPTILDIGQINVDVPSSQNDSVKLLSMSIDSGRESDNTLEDIFPPHLTMNQNDNVKTEVSADVNQAKVKELLDGVKTAQESMNLQPIKTMKKGGELKIKSKTNSTTLKKKQEVKQSIKKSKQSKQKNKNQKQSKELQTNKLEKLEAIENGETHDTIQSNEYDFEIVDALQEKAESMKSHTVKKINHFTETSLETFADFKQSVITKEYHVELATEISDVDDYVRSDNQNLRKRSVSTGRKRLAEIKRLQIEEKRKQKSFEKQKLLDEEARIKMLKQQLEDELRLDEEERLHKIKQEKDAELARYLVEERQAIEKENQLKMKEIEEEILRKKMSLLLAEREAENRLKREKDRLANAIEEELRRKETEMLARMSQEQQDTYLRQKALEDEQRRTEEEERLRVLQIKQLQEEKAREEKAKELQKLKNKMSYSTLVEDSYKMGNKLLSIAQTISRAYTYSYFQQLPHIVHCKTSRETQPIIEINKLPSLKELIKKIEKNEKNS